MSSNIYLVNTGILGEDAPTDILDMVFELLDRFRIDVLQVDTVLTDVYEIIIDRPLPRYLQYVPSHWGLGDWTIYSDDNEIPLYYNFDQSSISFFPPMGGMGGGYNTYFKNLEESVPKISLEEKMKFLVFETEEYAFLKIPEDEKFIRREGIDMQHCLSCAQVSYCERMVKGEIELYSMIDKTTGEAKVDIEVAIEIPSYNRMKVDEPTITQIRGPRNQCPPNDELLPSLLDFFETFGAEQGWRVHSHTHKNFDNRVDGDLLYARCKVLGLE